MSLQMFHFNQQVLLLLKRQLGLMVGVLLLLGGNAIAIPSNGAPFNLKQSENSTTPSNSGSSTPSVPPVSGDTRFACQVVNNQQTVVYYPESQPNQAYPWAVPSQLGGGWTPERRCFEISRRLESYRPDGLLELRTGVENGYNTICATTQQNSACRIVLTVPPGQDPAVTRDRVFETLTVADSGQQTEGVTTFTGNDGDILNRIGDALGIDPRSLNGRRSGGNSINLRPFLDPADGGTATRLQGGISTQSNPAHLNPDRFR